MANNEGAAQKKRGCGFWLLVAAGVFVGLAALGAIVGPQKEPEVLRGGGGAIDEASTEAAAPEEPANGPGMTAAEFAALRTGMSYSEAVEVIGSPGEVLSESELSGIRTVMYQWDGEGSFGANANVMFQNGKLVSKAQFGLD